MRTVGILALQGDYDKHRASIESIDGSVRYVRTAEDLAASDSLIIPGGESTTIGRLLVSFSLREPLRERIAAGMPVFGTCAGLIVLAREVEEKNQFRLGLLDVAVARNAYGRQIESFEADIPVPVLGATPVRAVFIRAPIVTDSGPGIEILAEYEGRPVLLRQGNMLAATFHPELTADTRIHRYFMTMGGGSDGVENPLGVEHAGNNAEEQPDARPVHAHSH